MKDEMAGTWRVCPHEIALLLDAARKGVLEEAATEADRLWVGTKGKSVVAAAIRALIDKPPVDD